MNRVIHISEYESISANEPVKSSNDFISYEDFKTLKSFLKKNKEAYLPDDKDRDKNVIMHISGDEKTIIAKGYVGVIAFSSGVQLEILPKIGDSKDIEKRKKILFEMLKTYHDFDNENHQSASIDIESYPIFEIYIKNFISKAQSIIKRGLKKSYNKKNEQSSFVKGKVLWNEQFKRNFAHKERFYITHDEFNVNRAENRLIKATLNKLYRLTSNNRNRTDIFKLLCQLDEVEESKDYKADFAGVATGRESLEYGDIVKWCRLFLENCSFSPFSGENMALALLFPINVLFENFVAKKLKHCLNGREFKIKEQQYRETLFLTKTGGNPYSENYISPKIIPDIYVKRADGAVFILDTKWKKLYRYDEDKHLGIEKDDVYQLCTYQTVFGAKSATLIYPLTKGFSMEPMELVSKNGAFTLRVQFFDVFNVEQSLDKLIKVLKE